MAALLVAMGILAIMMTVAMPVWKHAAQREKEEELVFRGTQYAHAIGLFSRKYANAFPPSLDVLVEQRFLRKKFKDPITGEDFQPILAGQGAPGISASPGAQTPGATAGRGAPAGRGTPVGAGGPASPPGTTGRGISPIGTPGAGGVGGVMGVTSKSKEKSIRLYNGRSHYNEWAFVFTPQVQQPGAVGAPGQPGQRGQPPGPPGQRGQTGPQRGNPGTFSPFPGRGNPTGPGGRGGAPPLFPPPGRGRSGG